MFRQRFLPIADGGTVAGRILRSLTHDEYFAWRDYTHLPMDAQAEQTIVFQVDGYWSLDPKLETLTSQFDYLNGKLDAQKNAVPDNDHFKLFLPLDGVTYDVEKGESEKDPQKRRYYFRNSQYQTRAPAEPGGPDPHMPDRVPYMWDFSFLLANASMWRAARLQPLFPKKHAEKWKKTPWFKFLQSELERENSLRSLAGQGDTGRTPDENMIPNVDDVRKALRSIRDKERRKALDSAIPWRVFLQACKKVAEHAEMHHRAKIVPFDFAYTSFETLNCLILEIWFSEIMLALDKFKTSKWATRCLEIVAELSRSEYKPRIPSQADLPKSEKTEISLAGLLEPTPRSSLKDILNCLHKNHLSNEKLAKLGSELDDLSESQGPALKVTFEVLANAYYIKRHVPYERPGRKELAELLEQTELLFPFPALCLYKTWLLLLDVMNFEAIFGSENAFEPKSPKPGSPNAMVTRHWYRTACAEQTRSSPAEDLDDAPIPMRMPGHFSMRGDSFLASPEHNRSRLLADYALDLLSSRRANITRLQAGLGLPVRDILPNKAADKLPTGLVCRIPAKPEEGDKPTEKAEINYGDLCSFGGNYAKDVDPALLNSASCPPLWLFRNSIMDYDRVGRPFNRWLIRLFGFTITLQKRRGSEWRSGLAQYDEIDGWNFDSMIDSPEVSGQFFELCDLLVAELRAAERKNRGAATR